MTFSALLFSPFHATFALTLFLSFPEGKGGEERGKEKEKQGKKQNGEGMQIYVRT
jgi:hypothetical protein